MLSTSFPTIQEKVNECIDTWYNLGKQQIKAEVQEIVNSSILDVELAQKIANHFKAKSYIHSEKYNYIWGVAQSCLDEVCLEDFTDFFMQEVCISRTVCQDLGYQIVNSK